MIINTVAFKICSVTLFNPVCIQLTFTIIIQCQYVDGSCILYFSIITFSAPCYFCENDEECSTAPVLNGTEVSVWSAYSTLGCTNGCSVRIISDLFFLSNYILVVSILSLMFFFVFLQGGT